MLLRIVGWTAKQVIKLIGKVILRTDISGVERVPRKGPVLVVINHISFVDPFLLYITLPRPISALGKVELWDHLITRLIAEAWGTIPLHRGEMDLNAIKLAVGVLRDGGALGVAPEGTRSHHGRLLRARPGVALVLSKVPQTVVVPIAVYGQEKLLPNLKRLRRTKVTMVVGTPFCLRPITGRMTHEVRQAISDEMMLRIASLLPAVYHGCYAGMPIVEDYTVSCPEPGVTGAGG
ncbi:MAG: 2-acyl-glycerophospho-ethanolamine acyltransferase [Chloroflexi bacterium ADurb.Bin180]|nr:MAG: 2-acyl-glycerophospho-ethanolamine acyltransferase [Chloroflexi bacterium ADurb.Bin180]